MAHDGLFRESIPNTPPNIAEAIVEEPIRFEEPASTLEEGVARVKSVLDGNERFVNRGVVETNLAAAKSAWEARLAQDEASTKRVMSKELYLTAVTNWRAKLAQAVDPSEAKRAVEYFSESLGLLQKYEAAEAEVTAIPESSKNLFETSVREPEAFRAFVFSQALEQWKLNDEVHDYAEAIIELEQSKDAYADAQAAWYREYCPEAYDSLKQRQRSFMDTYNACEAWQTAVSAPWATQDDWKKLSHSTCTRTKTGLFGSYTSHEPLDEAAVAEKEGEFRELHADLFEKRNIVDAGLDGPCISLIERAGHDSVLWAELSRQSAFYTKDGDFELSPDKLKEQILRSGTRWYLPESLMRADESLKTAILASRAIRDEIQEARQMMSRRMSEELEKEREALVTAVKALEGFELAAREAALSEKKQDVLTHEAAVVAAYGRNAPQVNLFLNRLRLATFETNRQAEMLMPSVDTTSTFTKHLEDLGRNQAAPDAQIDSAREIKTLKEQQLAQMRLQEYLEGVLEEIDQPEKSGPIAMTNVIKGIEDTLFSDVPVNKTWGDPTNLLPYRGVSTTIENPLATFADRSVFKAPYDRLNSQVCDVTLSEGAKGCGKRMKTLIEKIEALEYTELRELGSKLRVKYAMLLQ